ncbi:MAG: RluA family pseudouridine synthase [Acutalibacteraceae bacterium]
MQIIFEDNEIVVCTKDAGIISEKGNGEEKSMVLLLENACSAEIYPVHRLDKNVGGLMVYAKTKSAAASLSAQISKHTFEKEYFAALHGKLEIKSGELCDLLYKDRRTNKTYVVKRQRAGVKQAKLTYEVVGEIVYNENTCDVVRVKLQTGRSHQIRVQFASRKHPIIGDRRYGAKDKNNRIELWSCSLKFVHPSSGEKMNFFENAPEEYLISGING